MGRSSQRQRPKKSRQWFLRPLWRDPAFIFCLIVSVLLDAASLTYLWERVTSPIFGVLVVAYFFLVWFIVCAIVSIPIGTIRGYWQGQQDSEESESNPELPRTKVQNVARVSGRIAGRLASRSAAQSEPDGSDGEAST